MEKTQPHPKRSRAQAAKSSHVIDLRQSAGSEDDTAPESLAPARTAAPLKPEPSHRRAAKAVEAPPAKEAPIDEPVATVAPIAPEPAPSSTRTLQSTPSARHRFWSALWRFLVLLVVFAIIVIGGTYLYIHYLSS